MLNDGIQNRDPNKKTTIIPSERDAILHAVKYAPENALIVLCSDVIPDALNLVQDLKEKEANELYEFSTENIPNLNESTKL